MRDSRVENKLKLKLIELKMHDSLMESLAVASIRSRSKAERRPTTATFKSDEHTPAPSLSKAAVVSARVLRHDAPLGKEHCGRRSRSDAPTAPDDTRSLRKQLSTQGRRG